VVRIDAVIEDFLTDKGKGKGGESGNYRQDAGRELDRFIDFLIEHKDSPTTFASCPLWPNGSATDKFSVRADESVT
jgi:hypothetical protein